MPHGHRTAELRSIAFHRLVAEHLDAEVLELASTRVERWIAHGGPVSPGAARRWQDLLGEGSAALASHLVEDTEEMRDLRQNTPFAGVLTPRERWQVISEIP